MDKIQKAIKRLQLAAQMSEEYYEQPLIITTSGGKDSDVCLHLAEVAKISYEVQHSHTTADAPETVRHVRETFRRLEEKGVKCTINWPTYKGQPVTMWSLIPQKLMPPTRIVRYCCDVLKERGGENRISAPEFDGLKVQPGKTADQNLSYIADAKTSVCCCQITTTKGDCLKTVG